MQILTQYIIIDFFFLILNIDASKEGPQGAKVPPELKFPSKLNYFT